MLTRCISDTANNSHDRDEIWIYRHSLLLAGHLLQPPETQIAISQVYQQN